MDRLVAILLVVLAFACEHDDTKPAPPPAAHVAIDAAPAPAPSPCDGIAAEYTAAIAAADQKCSTDVDCGCYQGGIGAKSMCGGVANAATVTQLDGIAKRYFAASCRLTQECAAWQCAPHCLHGACAR